ncbi:MAG: VTT domain-containing protein, partial [Opitutales bacterium]
MKRYLLVGGVIALLVLISFGVVEALEIPLLTDPSDVIEGGGWLAAAVGVGLLLADVFIPVPSSIVMIAHGAAFGILGGFLLSFVASVGGATIGWWVGRQGSAWMRRFVKEAEQAQADA